MTKLNKMLVILFLPILDSFILAYISQNKTVYLGGKLEVVYLVTSMFFLWAAIIIAALTFYQLTIKIRNKLLLRGISYIGYSVVLAFSSYHLFYWAFLLTNKYPPSIDVLMFMLLNYEQLPNHILQTSPIISISFVLLVVFFAYFIQKHIKLIVNREFTPKELTTNIMATFLLFIAWGGTSQKTDFLTPLQSVFKLHSSEAVQQANAQLLKKKLAKKELYTPNKQINKSPVIVILIESLRHDLINYEPSPLPFLKQLSNQYIAFDKAYATASHSNYADLAFWYSQYPLRTNSLQTYPNDAPWRGQSIFSAFQQHGYTTAYISSQNEHWGEMINWLKNDDVDYFYHSENFKGDTWVNEDDAAGLKKLINSGIATAGKIEDSSTIEIAKRWIDNLETDQFFLGLNLQNTHFSYVIPPEGKEPFQPADMGFNAIYYRWPEENKVNVKNRYLNAVLNVDQIIASFTSYLKQKKLWDDTLFVVVGDSGEAFYEHGFGNHSGPMYEEVMRTFALLKPPTNSNVPLNKINKSISHIDIAASILDIINIKPPDTFQGKTVFSDDCQRPIYMHTNAIIKQNTLIDWPWKYMRTSYPSDYVELYNLNSDPLEQSNQASSLPKKAKALDLTLSSWVNDQLSFFYDPSLYTHYAPPTYCKK